MDDAIRLIFEYRDGEFRPQAPHKVQMIVPDLPRVSARGSGPGRFLELRSAEGKTVRSVPLAGEGPPTVEFPTGDPEQPFGRTEPPQGAVMAVVVPDDRRATHAALVEITRTRTRSGTLRLAKRDLAVVSLTDEQPE